MHQMHLLMSSYSPDGKATRPSPVINPYSQVITAKDPATLLQVVEDYRASDPLLKRLQTQDMQTLVETTIEHLESSSRVQGNSPDHEGQER